MNYIIINGELYHHGVKGMKWGVRRAQKKAERAERKAKMTPEEQRKRKIIKNTAIIGASAVAAGLAAYGTVRLKKYIDNKKRIKAGEEFVRRVAYAFEKRALEREMAIKRVEISRAKVDRVAVNNHLNSLQDNLMNRFREQHGLG